MADLIFKKDIYPLIKKDLNISSSNVMSHISGQNALRENTSKLETDEAYFCYKKYHINDSTISVIFIIMPKFSTRDVHIPKEIDEKDGVYFLELYQFTNLKYYKEIYGTIFGKNIYGIPSLNLGGIRLFLTPNCDVMSLHNSLKSNTKDFYDSREPYRRSLCTVYVDKDTKFKFDAYLLENESDLEYQYYYLIDGEVKPLCDAEFRIESGVLLSCTPCKYVKLPESIKEIKPNVFKDNLFREITLNYGLEVLNDNWFTYPLVGFDYISIMNMPSTIKRIGNYALPAFHYFKPWVSRKADPSESGEWIHGVDYGEKEYRYYILPYDLEYISKNAFKRDRGSYEKVYFVNDKCIHNTREEQKDGCLTSEGRNYVFKYSHNNDSLLYTKDLKRLVLVFSHVGRENTKSIILEEGLEVIEDGAFGQVKVEEIVCPQSLKEIKVGALDYSHIKRIIIKNGDAIYGPNKLYTSKTIKIFNSNGYRKDIEVILDSK